MTECDRVMQCHLLRFTVSKNNDHMVILGDHNKRFAVKFRFEPRDFDQKPRK